MIKIHSQYSKKVPGVEDYSSEHFSASMEVEVADEIGRDPKKLQSSLEWLWSELKKGVENQINHVEGRQKTQRKITNEDECKRSRESHKYSTEANKDNSRKASNKQIKYLMQLAKKQGFDFRGISDLAQNRFTKRSVYELNTAEASLLIDEFKN